MKNEFAQVRQKVLAQIEEVMVSVYSLDENYQKELYDDYFNDADELVKAINRFTRFCKSKELKASKTEVVQ